MNKTQIAVISGALLLIVLLFFANKKPPVKEAELNSGHAGNAGIQVTDIVSAARKMLGSDDTRKMEKLESAISGAADKKAAYEAVIDAWDSLKQPAVAAYWMEKAAMASPIAKNWQEAGNRYYAATQFVPDSLRPALFGKAIECFEHTLQLEPNNVEAKISLASCYVEGSAEPMKGISMLKEVEKTDSNNVNLQLNFAFFSEKSGQWDKAIERFQKVLKIKPDFYEAYLHLADAYQQKGDKAKTIESLEKYVSLVDDVTIKAEIQEYINKLKTN